jgi:hypothetical protein
MNPKFLLLALIMCQSFLRSKNDSITTKKYFIKVIIPSVLLAMVYLVLSDAIKNLNTEIKEVTENIDHKITIDDFSIPTSYRLWFKCNGDKG